MNDNIFLRAALSKEVQQVQSPTSSTSFTFPRNVHFVQQTSALKQNIKHRSTPVEEMLIAEGMNKYGRDGKSVVLFIQRHSEILGEPLCDYYNNIEKTGEAGMKKAMERVRKIANKCMDKARNIPTSQATLPVASTSKEPTSAEQEFQSNSEESESDSAIASIWQETEREVSKKDTRYCKVQGAKSREDILTVMESGQDDHCQDKTKMKEKKKRKGKEPAKMNALMRCLPELISNANNAAKDHSKALKKWMDLQDDSD